MRKKMKITNKKSKGLTHYAFIEPGDGFLFEGSTDVHMRLENGYSMNLTTYMNDKWIDPKHPVIPVKLELIYS
jgi:hypothetical protein